VPVVVGICAGRERARWAFWDQTAHLVADSYIAAMRAAGAATVLLPVDATAVDAVLDRVEGVLLIGGADIDPAVPYLGICRGMQILNVALGGTLRQDLGDPTPHRRVLGSFDGTEHEAQLAPGSLAAQALGERRPVIRCHHHPSVMELGVGGRITGRAVADGVPEAIESIDGSWTLGVQWHPEAGESMRLFAAFAEAAERYARDSAR
jgi:putative glutamine amidotransferase